MRRPVPTTLAVTLAAPLVTFPAGAAPATASPTQDTEPEQTEFILDIEATILDIETGIRTTESNQEVTITLEADVFFDFDEHELRPDAEELLVDVAGEIEDDGATDLVIGGHTDAEGSDDYNQDLSERRAGSVESFLADQLDGVTMTTEGFGEAEPVAPNDTDEGRARNRRVEITYPQ